MPADDVPLVDGIAKADVPGDVSLLSNAPNVGALLTVSGATVLLRPKKN